MKTNIETSSNKSKNKESVSNNSQILHQHNKSAINLDFNEKKTFQEKIFEPKKPAKKNDKSNSIFGRKFSLSNIKNVRIDDLFSNKKKNDENTLNKNIYKFDNNEGYLFQS